MEAKHKIGLGMLTPCYPHSRAPRQPHVPRNRAAQGGQPNCSWYRELSLLQRRLRLLHWLQLSCNHLRSYAAHHRWCSQRRVQIRWRDLCRRAAMARHHAVNVRWGLQATRALQILCGDWGKVQTKSAHCSYISRVSITLCTGKYARPICGECEGNSYLPAGKHPSPIPVQLPLVLSMLLHPPPTSSDFQLPASASHASSLHRNWGRG